MAGKLTDRCDGGFERRGEGGGVALWPTAQVGFDVRHLFAAMRTSSPLSSWSLPNLRGQDRKLGERARHDALPGGCGM